MGFHEVQFPTSISYGSSGGPGYRTSIVTLRSGAEERIAHLSRPRHRYNVAEGVKSWDDLSTLKTFYIARTGPANGFRFKDWLDYTSNADGRTALTPSDQYCSPATGDGTNKTFQLVKRYINSPSYVTRTITKPVSGTTRMYVNTAEVTSGWSVDTTTGIVTFDTAPTNGHVVKAGYQFDVPVRFGKEVDELFDVSLDAFDSGSLTVPLVELFNEDTADDDYWYGGASSLTLTAATTVTKAHGRMITCTNTSGSSQNLVMPDKDELALGGPHFVVYNSGDSTHNVLVKDDDGSTTLITLQPATSAPYYCEIWLGLNSSSARTYYVLR